MVVYAIYHGQFRGSPGDALHLQKQVILRNSSSDFSTASSMKSLWWLWRSRTGTRALSRTFGIFLAAIFNFFFFVLLLPFLANLLSTGDNVLIHSPNCGFWLESATLKYLTTTAVVTNRTWAAVNYVDNCYNTDTPSSSCDDNLMRRQIKWSPNNQYGCPFNPLEVCLGSSAQDDYHTFTMETELIDSHKDLGINAQPKDRIQLQRLTTCAILNTTDYTSSIDDPVLGEMEVFNFGPLVNADWNYTTSASPYDPLSNAGFVLESVPFLSPCMLHND